MKLKYSDDITALLASLDEKHREFVVIERALNDLSNRITNGLEAQFDIHEGQVWKDRKTGHRYEITGLMTAHIPDRKGGRAVAPLTFVRFCRPGYATITSVRLDLFLDSYERVS